MNSVKFKANKRIYIIAISAIIVILLIFSSPVKALILNLNSDKSLLNIGELITFDLTVKGNQAEPLSINKIVFEVVGPSYVYCAFKSDGSVIEGCNGITIKVISNQSPYGYGYSGYGYSGSGYGYSTSFYGYANSNEEVRYQIILNSANLKSGDYQSLIKVHTNENIYSMNGQTFNVRGFNPPQPPTNDTNNTTNDNNETTNRNIRINTRSDSICESDWVCTKWSACVNGNQIRTCTIRDDRCYGIQKPSEVRLCSQNMPEVSEKVITKKQDEQVTSSRLINSIVDFFGGFIGAGLYLLIIAMSMLIGLCLGFIMTGETIYDRKRRVKRL